MMKEEELTEIISAVQLGEYDVLKEALRRKLISATLRDHQGCTLLHWAAINNRQAIANLLIDNGAEIHAKGGFLGETPLQWAIRRKYYSMASLLIRKGGEQCFESKSTRGANALTTAIETGDVNMVFLCLQMGAPLNQHDENGDTPLLHELKKQGRKGMALIQLFLHFGASANDTNAQSTNNALHVLAFDKEANSFVACALYRVGGVSAAAARNCSGFTPYTQAVQSGNRKIVSNLFDHMLFSVLPYHTVTMISFLSTVAAFLLIGRFGWAFGLFYYILGYLFVFRFSTQFSLTPYRDRIPQGIALALLVLLQWYYYVHILPILNQPIYPNLTDNNATGPSHATTTASAEASTIATATTTATSATVAESASATGFDTWLFASHAAAVGLGWLTTYLYLRSCWKKPVVIPPLDRSELLNRIIHSSPKEGTYEEAEQGGRGRASSVTKDVESPNVVVPVPAASDEVLSRIKYATSQGPSLCTICLTDMPALASHCKYCGVCVAEKCMHVEIIGNCLGKGNMRPYFLFLLSAMITCIVFMCSLVTAHYRDAVCGVEAAGLFWGFFSMEICIARRQPLSFLFLVTSLALVYTFFIFFNTNLALIVWESTLHLVKQGRYTFVNKPIGLVNIFKTLYRFLSTGQHKITLPQNPNFSQNSLFGGVLHDIPLTPSKARGLGHSYGERDSLLGGHRTSSRDELTGRPSGGVSSSSSSSGGGVMGGWERWELVEEEDWRDEDDFSRERHGRRQRCSHDHNGECCESDGKQQHSTDTGLESTNVMNISADDRV